MVLQYVPFLRTDSFTHSMLIKGQRSKSKYYYFFLVKYFVIVNISRSKCGILIPYNKCVFLNVLSNRNWSILMGNATGDEVIEPITVIFVF